MSSRRARTWLWTASLVGGLMLAFMAGITAILGLIFARRVVTPVRRPKETVRVVALDQTTEAGRVTLTLGEDALLSGKYSLLFSNGAGHAKLGHVVAQTRRTVTRELIAVDRGSLSVGVRGRITGWWFADPDELGFPVEDVSIPTEVGPCSAWLITPAAGVSDHWAIHVHGRGARREETLRGVPPFIAREITSLVVSYRNDVEGQPASDGRYGLGTDEWRDVDSAITEAVRRGAQRITLVGWSMGGTSVLLAAEQSEHAPLIDALILESPAISWPNLLAHHATLSRVPTMPLRFALRLIEAGSGLTGRKAPIPVAQLTPERFAASLRVPTLVISSRGDSYVPDTPVRTFSERRPEFVTWVRMGAGEHVKIWNVNERAWVHAVEEFLVAQARSQGL